MTKRKPLSGKSWRGEPLGAFLVFPRRHHCSIFAAHWAMTLFSNVRYTSALYGSHWYSVFDGEHPASRERFILPIKPARSREFNPFHRKHHKASNASSERRSNKTASKVPLFSVKHPHMVKGDRLRGIGCSPPYINPNRYTRYVLTDFRDLITVKITHKYALRGIVPVTSLCARQTSHFVHPYFTAYSSDAIHYKQYQFQ